MDMQLSQNFSFVSNVFTVGFGLPHFTHFQPRFNRSFCLW